MNGQVNEHEEQVYFIQAVGGGDLIKIGLSKSPVKRMYHLQHAGPHPLRLLFFVQGSRAMEGELHARFSHIQEHGEWFRPESELLGFMRELWRKRQAHRATVMGYDCDKFYAILVAKDYDWKDKSCINAALYWRGAVQYRNSKYGDVGGSSDHPAIEEFISARTVAS